MDFPRTEPPELGDGEIVFQILDWYVPESDRNRERQEEADLFTMVVYGTTAVGTNVCVNVTGYEPYFYVKPPEEWEGYNDTKFLSSVMLLKENMEDEEYECVFKRNGRESKFSKKIVPDQFKTHLKEVSMVKKKEFWGFTNNQDFRFIKVSVLSLGLFNNLKYYFQSMAKKGFKMYESNIDPFLRYIHQQNIKPCGWVSIAEYEIKEENNTRCDYNIETSHTCIKPVEVNSIAPLLIASFDIECSSSHGDFPVAIKDYRKVAQDLANVAKAGYDITEKFLLTWLERIYTQDVDIDETIRINKVYPKKRVDFGQYKDHVIDKVEDIIGFLNKISDISSGDTSDDEEGEAPAKSITRKEQMIHEARINDILTGVLPPLKGDKIIQIGTTVHRYGSEEIIYKNIISLNDCDEIEGTDVVSCKTEKQVLMEWKKLMASLNPDIIIGYNIFGFDMEYMNSRAIDNNMLDDFTKGLGRKLERKSNMIRQELSSSAFGENTLKYFDMDGTVVIDLFKVMQRDHKLDSYKLDNVAQVFLGDKKDDLKPHEIFEKFLGSSEDRCVIAKYCIQDCILVNKLLHKLKILENNIGMGNVCLVPLNYLFRRGQGIKIFSLIAKECMDRNQLIPVIRSFNPESDFDRDGYEGAVVLEPKEGIYLDDPIVVFDYGSLYPSSMIARNLSHDCYVLDDKYKVDDPNIEYAVVSYDIYSGVGDKKKKVGEKNCTFAQYKDGKKGIIVEILSLLLQQRKNTKKKMEYMTIKTLSGQLFAGVVTDKGDSYSVFDVDTGDRHTVDKSAVDCITETFSVFEQDVFDALQLAYKVTANSLYGQIGSRTSPIYLKEIAACTTATGREMIMLAKEYVETKYNAEVIYGDTDSIFCKFPLVDGDGNPVKGKESLKYAIEIGKKVEESIVSIMPSPQKLNYEKSLYPFILFSKKKYVGNLYENSIEHFKQKSMGIVLKRRDNAPIVKKIFGGIIDILLNEQDLDGSVKFLSNELNELVSGKTPIKDLVITKKLSAAYKDATKIPHKVLADRIAERDPGNRPQVNDRVPFVYIKVNDAKLQGDRIENPDYIEAHSLVPDHLHYITNQIMNPVLQLFALCLGKLPNYDRPPGYWIEVDNELKRKPIYEDDAKRKNRIDRLKLNTVKELLFDPFIDMLSEPKKKPKRLTKGTIVSGDNITEPKKERKQREQKEPKDENPGAKTAKPAKPGKEAKDADENVVINITDDGREMLHADIKVVQKKEPKSIVAVAKIVRGKKTVWQYSNDNCANKEREFTSIILDMVSHIKSDNALLKIKINLKKFKADYYKALCQYREMERAEIMDQNIVMNAMKNNDVGIIKNVGSILQFERLIESNSYFVLDA